MNKLFPIFMMFAIPMVVLPAKPSTVSQEPTARAWMTLQQGLTCHRAEKRANAVHALRLLPHNAKAQEMAEKALADPSPKVRASAARALGPMGAESSVPKLKTALNDVEPSVVLAAAHSLFVLGHRDEVYDIDYEVLTGERKSADGFVKSQMNELKDPRAVAKMGLETGIGFAPFGGEAYEAFKRISKDDRSPVRAAAAKELVADRDPKIDAALAKACSDKKWPVRAAAVWAIAKRDDPTLLKAVTAMLGDKSEIVRYDASAAVVRLTALRARLVEQAGR
jgi:HEAT repeat protein